MQSMPVKKLSHYGDMELPKYETPGSAGMDLRAAIDHPVTIDPGERKMIPTGISIAVPQGYVGQVCSRSGLGHKHGVVVIHAPGIIDSDYRGELMINLINLDKRVPFVVNRGDRVAQLLIIPIIHPQWLEVDELTTTERGHNGFGSTGHK